MRKRTTIFCSFLLTALLMTGCGCGKTPQTPQPSSVPQTSIPAAGTEQVTSKASDKSASLITEEDAKSIALTHADLVIEEVTFTKCELDRETDGANYDVEFHTEDRLEYDYEIDAYTGKIISYEWDEDELFLE
jgi:hypothetical protein